MRAILVRVGIDQAFGGWNAPIDPRSNEFVFVPIPEDDRTLADPALRTRYDDHADELALFADAKDARCALPDRLRGVPTHHDPDFRYLTYGDIATNRGREIATLEAGDLLVFYSGLRPVAPCAHRLIYALTGQYEVAEVLRADQVESSRLHENAHTRMAHRTNDHLIVRAKPDTSGRFDRAIPVGSFRDRAYRLTPEVLEAWGGISARNGYLQRSARPPRLLDPSRYLEWLGARHPGFRHALP